MTYDLQIPKNFDTEFIDLPIERVFVVEDGARLPFVNVMVDQVVIMVKQSDVFVMATEALIVPYWSFDWYMGDSTDVSTGKRLFQTYIDAFQFYYDNLYNFAQIDMGRVGLNLQINMYENDLQNAYMGLLNYCLGILTALSRYKEIYYIEYGGKDLALGPIPINTCTYHTENNNLSISDPGSWYGDMNWNILDPQRFETYLEGLDGVYIYDASVSDSDIQASHGIPYTNLDKDTLIVNWSSEGVTGIEFPFSIHNRKQANNLILTFSNVEKPSSVSGQDLAFTTSKKYLFKGEKAIGQFCQAFSWFFLQPMITHKLQKKYREWNGYSLTNEDMILFPSPINTKSKQDNFINYYKENYAYGQFMMSGMVSIQNNIFDE